MFLYKLWHSIARFMVVLFLCAGGWFLLKESGFLGMLPATQVLESGELSPNITNLFVDDTWMPSEGAYGIFAILSGTASVVVIGVAIAVPLSCLAAVTLTFGLSLPLRQIFRIVLQTFSGIPAVVIGLFGLMQLVPLLGRWNAPGFGLLAAGIALALLLIPQTVLHASEILEAESLEWQQLGQSLGLSFHSLLLKVLLPLKLKALLQSAVLCVSRGLSETLAILMVAGNVVQIPAGLFEPFRTINATIALEMPYALDNHRQMLFTLGFVTFALVMLVRVFAMSSSRA